MGGKEREGRKDGRTLKSLPCQVASVPQRVVGSLRERRRRRRTREINDGRAENEDASSQNSPHDELDLNSLLSDLLLVSSDEGDDRSSVLSERLVGGGERVVLERVRRREQVSEGIE